jgi:hypothetical protein
MRVERKVAELLVAIFAGSTMVRSLRSPSIRCGAGAGYPKFARDLRD